MDEIDSVNFAMGVHHFNLWEHQPHPPGYPLYVFLGWLALAILDVEPNNSLHFVSAVGGGLLIAAWFLIIRLQFNERLAWWVAGCLAVTPVICMTATKVLTDSLAAGLLSAQILGAVIFSRTASRKALLATGLLGAAAAGARPQLFLVAVVVLATGLIAGPRVPRKWAWLGWVCLIGGCLLWLVPMWYTQSQLKPGVAAGSVYPQLVYKFWAGRLDKPSMYLFAEKWTLGYIAGRCAFHFLGWFGVGFGFLQSWAALLAGALVSIAGVVLYLFGRRTESDKGFWKFHLPWAFVHIAAIFISLPASQRYYVVIFPLLLVPLLRGFLQLHHKWNNLAFALPAVLLLTTIPISLANRRDEAPPIRFVRHLQQLYPPDQREKVVLLLSTRTKRHAEWYSPDFKIVSPIPQPELLPEITRDAVAVYTDDPWVSLPPGWYRLPLNAFTRSVIIYWKVHYLELYLIDRQQGR
ncbi:MAG TPA: glycosyltransferase family 39 protein [Chthoniobacterales bacterium]|nr:glycosyltransferase family 39 protein [Chthoniobacterales bacterium]